LIGLFANTLVLRTDLSGNPSFREVLRRAKEVALGAYAHQDLPFEKLVEELQPARDAGRHPVFQTLFALQPVMVPVKAFGGLQLTHHEEIKTSAKFDVSLYLTLQEGRIEGHFEYAVDLFEGSTIERLASHLAVLLEGIVRSPSARLSELPLMDAVERNRLVDESNATAVDYPQHLCLHELFALQAMRTPEAAAVVYETEQLTYGELDRRSNQLAHHLRGLGVGPEVVVGLCVDRSLEMVVGLLGILKAGGAYLPLDPNYPADRLEYMLQDTKTPVVVMKAELASQLPAHEGCVVRIDADWDKIALRPETGAVNTACPGNLAYVIFTSGSTGKPKGV